MELIIASNNPHKVDELKRILKPLNITVYTLKDKHIEISDIEENGTTFAENAKIKAKAVFDIINMPVLADDSGLCVDALMGQPGVYTARYAGANATDEDKYNKVLNEMLDVPFEKRTARFVTSICCIIDDHNIITADGVCNGKIALKSEGVNGFGYDPIFLTEYNKTFAELSDEQKDEISHRGKALRNFYEKIKEYMN